MSRSVEALLPVVVFAVALLVWQGMVSAFSLPLYLVPGPATVVGAAWTQKALLLTASRTTMLEALVGFVTSAIAGISSLSAAERGLPQFCDSSFANSAASASMRSASFISNVPRSFGTVAAQAGNAFAADCTALAICSSDASCTCAITLPVAGSTSTSV